MKEYIYILANKDWQYENKFKFGYTKNPIQRIKNSHEQHSYLSIYVALYEIERTAEYSMPFNEYDKILYQLSSKRIEKLKRKYKHDFDNLASITKHLVSNNGSNEFIYKDGLEVLESIVLEDFKMLGLYTTKIDVCDVNVEIKNYYDSNKSPVHQDSDDDSDDECHTRHTHPDGVMLECRTSNITPRRYQQELIEKIIRHLKDKRRCYLELPTGGGKSVIVYNVIDIIKPKVILIFSPRKIINAQNISKKYVNILQDNYTIHDDITRITKGTCTQNTIIVSCIQSCNKIYEHITKYNIRNIFVWFDEAHWSLEGWIGNVDKRKEFFLNDEKHITWRLFTSASPDENFVKEHKPMYGELINDVSVKQLIDERYLCNINPYIFSTKKDDPNILEYNLKNFEENNKIFGMSFHNNTENAYELFKQHCLYYAKGGTTIHPFLLVSDKEFGLTDNDSISGYNYKDIKTFEKTERSVGYVVAQYSMGYDFNLIDTIFLSDPKLSHKDIIQTIGRGMRPDMLGIDGTNSNKVLHIYLPTYLEDTEDTKNEYKKIIEVLKYLLNHIKLTFDDIKFGIKKPKKDKDICAMDANCCDIYKGCEDVKAKLLNIIREGNSLHWTNKRITRQLTINNIHNSRDYEQYNIKNIHLGLPEVPILFSNFKDFSWYNTYKDGECPYYNREECMKAIKNIDYDDEGDEDDDDLKINYLNSKDKKIPNTNLSRFYGGILH